MIVVRSRVVLIVCVVQFVCVVSTVCVLSIVGVGLNLHAIGRVRVKRFGGGTIFGTNRLNGQS